ncbi:hypothetical protein L9F63_000141, partial [Diploptera punctata]
YWAVDLGTVVAQLSNEAIKTNADTSNRMTTFIIIMLIFYYIFLNSILLFVLSDPLKILKCNN